MKFLKICALALTFSLSAFAAPRPNYFGYTDNEYIIQQVWTDEVGALIDAPFIGAPAPWDGSAFVFGIYVSYEADGRMIGADIASGSGITKSYNGTDDTLTLTFGLNTSTATAIATAKAEAIAAPPAAHNQAWSTITATPTTLVGYGITDADASGAAATAQATAIQRANHTGTQSADTVTDGTTNKAFLATDRTKLAGIATGATANDTDANLRARSSHTGTQVASTIGDSTTVGRAVLTATDAAAARTAIGAGTGNGSVTSVALSSSTLTVSGTVTTSGSLPVDLPAVGTSGTYNRVTTDAYGRVTAGTVDSIAGVSRSIVTTTSSTGFQIDASRNASACYDIDLSSTSTIGGASTVIVYLETADTNSTTPGDWTTVAKVSSGQTITLAIALQSVQTSTACLARVIPAGKYVRIRSSITGTASAVYAYGQEVKQ